jgi:hypothetical protein
VRRPDSAGAGLIEEEASVTVLEGHRLEVHHHGHLLIDATEETDALLG